MIGFKIIVILLADTILCLGESLSETSNCAFDVKGITSTNIFMNTFRLGNGVKFGHVDLRKNAHAKEKCNHRPIGIITLACDDPRNNKAPEIIVTFNEAKHVVKVKRVSETLTGDTEIQVFVYCEELV